MGRIARAGHATATGSHPVENPVDHLPVIPAQSTTPVTDRQERPQPFPLGICQITPPHVGNDEPTSRQARDLPNSPGVRAYFAGFVSSVPKRPFVAGEPRSLGSMSDEPLALSPPVPAYSRAAAPTPPVRFGMPTARSALPSPL